MVAIIGPPDKINYTISQQVVSNPYVQQPNSSNIIKIIQFVAVIVTVIVTVTLTVIENEMHPLGTDPLTQPGQTDNSVKDV